MKTNTKVTLNDKLIIIIIIDNYIYDFNIIII